MIFSGKQGVLVKYNTKKKVMVIRALVLFTCHILTVGMSYLVTIFSQDLTLLMVIYEVVMSVMASMFLISIHVSRQIPKSVRPVIY